MSTNMGIKPIYTGVVESRDDPMKLGRCRVRIIGVHTEDKSILPTENLPWAMPMLPITSASMNGIGHAPVGPVPGSHVSIIFMDESMQTPIMVGTIPVLPQSEAAKKITNQSGLVALDGEMFDSFGSKILDQLSNPLSLDSAFETVMGKTVDSVLGDKLSSIITDATGIIDTVGNYPGELASCVLSNVEDVVIDAVSGVAKKIDNVIGDVIEEIDDVFDSVDDLISSGLQEGIDFIKSSLGGPLSSIENGISRIGNVVSTTRSAVDTMTEISMKEFCTLPKWKQLSVIEDRSSSLNFGFRDPSGKYPLKTMLDEANTNRLSRGVIEGTAVEFMNKSRAVEVPLPNSDEKWNQPKISFGGVYPYSSVIESESGHITIKDDSPGKESTCEYHRAGTYQYVGPSGEKITKIVNNNYTIIDKDGNIKIEGKCSIAIGGDVRLYAGSNSNIQIIGNSNIVVGGNLSVKTSGTTEIISTGKIDITSSESVNVKAPKINLN